MAARSFPFYFIACTLSVVNGVLPSIAAAAPATTRPATKPALPRALDGVVIEQNVAYLSPERKEKLDLYLPANRAADVRSPAVLIIHGGGWSGGDKAAGREFNIGTTLAKAGYVCASVNYMMEPGKRWPTNLHDCKNAVRFLRKNAERYQIDADHIGAIGGSAGGHLALMVAYTSGVAELEPSAPYPGISSKISAVVDLYGPTNLLTRRKTDKDGKPVGEAVRTSPLFEGSPDDQPAQWKLASPVSHVSRSSPPTLILHGTKDTTVDRGQSDELAARLKEAGVEHRLFIVEDAGHTFDLQTWARKPLTTDLRPMVVGFFDKHLRGK